MSDEEDYTAEDAEADVFWGDMMTAIRVGFVQQLLAGNDTECFSTEQYRTLYSNKWKPPEGMPQLTVDQARSHLSHLACVEETSPDVWIRRAKK